MSCYLRHLKDILNEAGVEVSSQNRTRVDQTIHNLIGTTYKDCPATWKKVKQEILTDGKKRQDFIQKLKEALK